MSKEKEMKQHLQQYDKDTLIELYLQKDFDTKHQLVEKDKEITSLQESLDWERKDKTVIVKQLDDPNAYVSLEDYKNSRHQICEKIRKALKIEELRFEWEGKRKSIYETLDQIEKGE